MLKLTGAFIVIAAATYWGLSGARDLRFRAQILRQMESALHLMEREVAERLTPIPQVISMLSDSSDGQVAAFFRSLDGLLQSADEPFSQLWQQTLDKGPDLHLKGPERAVLGELGGVLGRYSAAQQSHAIAHAALRVKEFASLAEADAAGRSKLLVTAGLCSGIFVVILLF